MITNIWDYMNVVSRLKLTAVANSQVFFHLDFFLYSIRLSKKYA